MPIPPPGEEKRLGKIRKEFDGDGYSSVGSTEQTSLNDAADGDYGEVNQASEQYPSPTNPDNADEFSSYDHSSTADVYGCMDSTANNYNPIANVPDDCTYTSGCTDPTACNFNPAAVQENGSCTFPEDLFPGGFQDCDGNCFDDSDGDGVCDELEIGGCTNPNAVDGTWSLLGTDFAAFGGPIIGNYNPDATDNTGCTMIYLACTDPGAVDYTTAWSDLPSQLEDGGFLDVPGVSQVIETDNTMCNYTVPTPYPPDEPPYWTGDTTVVAWSGASYPSIYGTVGLDPISWIGRTTGLLLDDIVYGGGPGNIVGNYYLNNSYHNSFIRYVTVYAHNYDANGLVSNWTAAAADKGAYKMYWYGTYNQNPVDLYEMIEEHGGNISIAIGFRSFRSSLNVASTVSYYGNQPTEGVHWNTSPSYSGDNPYYFRQCYLRWLFDDIDFSDGGANTFDPQTYGTCYPSCDPPIYFPGCVDMLNPGNATDEDDWDCPNGPNVLHQQVRQRWHHTAYVPPVIPEGEAEVAMAGMDLGM